MKLWPFRTGTSVEELEPLIGYAEFRTDGTLRPADLRADALGEKVVALEQELTDVTEQRDELLGALDWQRPAPNPFVLGTVLEKQWWKAPDGLNTSQQWLRIAETAIDYVRGLWPLDPPAPPRCVNCSDPTEALSTRGWCVACEVIPDPARRTAWLVPKTSPGGGESAGVSSSPTGAPAPGDTYVFRPGPFICGYCGAVTGRPVTDRGWCETCEQHDHAARAEQIIDDLARALAAHDEKFTGMKWDHMKAAWQESYLGLAAAVIAAGWRPPLTTGAAQ